MGFSVRVDFGEATVANHDFSDDKTSVTIGRAPNCDIVLDNLGVSRTHAEIASEGRLWVVRDLKSNNGTFVNGKRVRTYNLNDGDTITIGKFTLTYSADHKVEDEMEGDAEGGAGGGSEGGQTMMIDRNAIERRAKQRSTALKAYLVVKKNDKEETVFLDQAIFTIGKANGSDLKVGGGFFDWTTQNRHAVIFRDDSGFHLVDTSQKGRTLVNGDSSDIKRLRDGDEIRIGRKSFTFKVGTPLF